MGSPDRRAEVLTEFEKRSDADLLLPADAAERGARRQRAEAMLEALATEAEREPADIAATIVTKARLLERKLQPTVRELAHLRRAASITAEGDPKIEAIVESILATISGAADADRANVGLARLAAANIFGVIEVGLDGKIRDANDAALRLLALRRRSLPHMRLSSVFADNETTARVQQAIDAQAAFGPERCEVQTVDSGRAVADLAVVPNGEGATLFLYDTVRTAVRDADAEQIAFRARMLSILAHDLRTPLAAVVANAQRLSKQTEFSPTNAESIARLSWSAERMRRLLDDLVELAAAGAGEGIPIAREEIDIGSIAASVIAELKEENPARAIVLSAEGNLKGRWDADRLAQAISNITRHALRQGATDAQIDVTMVTGLEQVSITVATRKRPASVQTSHTGVGLYVAQQIVAAHGGLLEVVTREGNLRFTARLPRIRAEAAAPPSGGSSNDGANASPA